MGEVLVKNMMENFKIAHIKGSSPTTHTLIDYPSNHFLFIRLATKPRTQEDLRTRLPSKC